MKKFLAILLTLLMVLPVFSVMVVAEAAPDQNAEPGSEAYTAWLKSEGYTAIDDDEDFLTMTANGKYYLANDIVEDNNDVNYFGDTAFTGVIDGNGYTIYNWNSYISNNICGTIRNVTFSDRVSENGDKFSVTWSLFGKALGDGAVLENVVNYRDSGDVGNYYGLFVREVNSGKITFRNCKNYGSMHSPYGKNNHKIGGFIGMVNGGEITFENCHNYADISASQVGGFIGILKEGVDITLTFKNCTNEGTITGVAGLKDGKEAGRGKSGGFIGNVNNSGTGATYNITFENCTNTGDILRKDGNANSIQAAQGGFIGWIKATTLNLTMTNCVVKDCKVDGTGTNNTSTGGEASGLIGRLIPNSANGTISISNCTVENVVIEAYNAGRKFAFVCGNSSYPVTLVNCYANNVTYSDGKAAKLFEEVTVDGVKVMAVNLAYNITEESSVVSINKAQQSVANAEGKTAVRFIGTVNGLGFAEIGYYVELNGKAIKLTTDTVYNSLNNNYGENQITAESLNAAFLTAVVMNDVTADFNGTIKVTPFVKNLDGTYTYGKTKAISFTNGAIGECL